MNDNYEDNGGSAFPFNPDSTLWMGMTLRDYLAAAALPAIVADRESLMGAHTRSDAVTQAATWAYEYADALLKARLL